MSLDADVIVVGSGPAGAQAAQTLVEKGCTVMMLDVGFGPRADLASPPERPFIDLRRSDPAQHTYFLGADFEGVPLHRLGAAPQVTPPRRYVLETALGHKKILTDEFAALESHALGGLGAAWGAVSFPFLPIELERAGLSPSEMAPCYEQVARRIGIGGGSDDLDPLRGALDALEPALSADHNAAALLSAYERQRDRLRRRGIFVGRPLLAALSSARDGRSANEGQDMDFWANPGGSSYRPDITVRALQRHDRFFYRGNWRVESFAEKDSVVTVAAVSADGALQQEFRSRALVLAAGALGTTRIVLRSLRAGGERVPLVCNAHLYVPCVHLRQLGRPHAAQCHSLAQLTMIHSPSADAAHLVQAQMYSYRSLLLFRLLKEAPLPHREALRIMRALAPSFVIWAIEHEDEPVPQSFCRLLGDGVLEAVHPVISSIEKQRRGAESALMRAMRQLGCWPIRRVHSGPGSSLHYGGQLPATETDSPLTTDRRGRLRGTRAVHIVDGAALRYLPAKGPTFTIMANADRVARHVAASLREISQVGVVDADPCGPARASS